MSLSRKNDDSSKVESDNSDDGSGVAVDPLLHDTDDALQEPKQQQQTRQRTSVGQLLQAYVKFMASPLHQDRGLKLMQYTLWVAGQLYGSKSNNNSENAALGLVRKKGLEKLSLDLSWVRMANRLLQWPMAMDAAWNGSWTVTSQRYPRTFRFLGAVMALSMTGYYPAEHVAYLHWMAPQWLSSNRSAEKFCVWSCRFWAAYLVAEAARCLLQLRELHDDKDVDEETKSETRRALRLQVLRNALWMGPVVNWSRSDGDIKPLLSSKNVNGLCWLEAIVSLYQSVKGFQAANK